MLDNEIANLLPANEHEFKLRVIEALYEYCRKSYTGIATPLHYFGTFPEVTHDQQGKSPVFSLTYLPESRYLRIQMFPGVQSHAPSHSFICAPHEILELGTTDRGSFTKTHRPYVNVIDGKIEWVMTRTTAPRNLSYMAREMIPTGRTEFITAISDLMSTAERRMEPSRNLKVVGDQAMRRRRGILLQRFMILHAKIDGYNQDELSYPFIQNLRNNYVFVVDFFRQMYHASWTPEDEGKWLKRFFRALDPRTEVDGDVESALTDQWIKFCAESVDKPNQNSDSLNIGGWALQA